MRKTIVSVQFLRFIAASLVVLSHTTLAVGDNFNGSISKIFRHVANFGGTGVHIFFVISGFVMVYTSFDRHDTKFSATKFITRRLIRIYPIYFIYAALYLSFYYLSAGGKYLSPEQLLGSFLLYPGYSGDIIGPGWTLGYEVYFYFCFSIAMILGLTRGIVALTLFFLTAIVFGVMLHTSQPTIHVLTNSLLIEFLAGAWIGYAVVSSVYVGNKFANIMLALAVTGFLSGIAFGYNHLPSLLTWGVPSVLLVGGLVFREKNARVPALIKNYSFLGDSSYSLYLLHIVLIDAVILLAMYLDESLSTRAALVGTFGWVMVCFAITIYCIVVAHISYELIERRVVRSLQELYRRRSVATAS